MDSFNFICKVCDSLILNQHKLHLEIYSNLIIVRSQIRKYGREKILKLIIVRRTIIWTLRVLEEKIPLPRLFETSFLLKKINALSSWHGFTVMFKVYHATSLLLMSTPSIHLPRYMKVSLA